MGPRLYFVGGAPRCGKSILLNNLVSTEGLESLSTDRLRHAVQSMVNEQDEPALFANASPRGASAERVDRQNQESLVVWRAVLGYVEHYLQYSNTKLLVEGVAVLPAEVRTFESIHGPVRAIFVGNQDPEQAQHLMRYAQEHAHDWLREWSEQRVAKFVEFRVAMSSWLENEASIHDYPYIEMSGDFDAQCNKAKSALLNK